MTDTTAPPSSTGPAWSRHVWRGLADLFVAAVLVVPFVLINRAFSLATQSMDETFHMLLRFSALMGISLIFLQIMTGAFRPVLRRIFAPEALRVFHKGFGLAGLGFLILHFLFLLHGIRDHWAVLNHGSFLLGPVVLTFLTVTVVAALLLGRLPPVVWIRLHVLNYPLFVVGAVHGLAIGTQTHTLAARLVFAVYLALALTGLIYRASSPVWRKRLAPSLARVDGER